MKDHKLTQPEEIAGHEKELSDFKCLFWERDGNELDPIDCSTESTKSKLLN